MDTERLLADMLWMLEGSSGGEMEVSRGDDGMEIPSPWTGLNFTLKAESGLLEI
jgi:hypothetical protein